jgi:hypothetical protein
MKAICRKYMSRISAFVSAIERGGMQLVDVTFDQQDLIAFIKHRNAFNAE